MNTLTRIGNVCILWTVNRLQRISMRRGANSHLPAHLKTGLEGERAAFNYLKNEGFRVVATRWSDRRLDGDLDLVAWEGKTLCFIEVKARTEHDASAAQKMVHAHKRRILRSLAREYLRQRGETPLPPVRFDIVAVYLIPGQKEEIVHFKAAFNWREGRGRDSWD